MGWFEFLLKHWITPFKTTLFPHLINTHLGVSIVDGKSGVILSNGKKYVTYKKGDYRKKYLTNDEHKVFSDKLSELANELYLKNSSELIERLNSIFEYLYFDECQDFVGYDYELIKLILTKTDITCVFAGDPRQHTYSTHTTSKYKKYSGDLAAFIHDYVNKRNKHYVTIDETTLVKSHRCPRCICDFRFKNYGLAPKSAADFTFLLHGFHFLKQDGTMAIILPHGVLFRGGAEERIRTKLLKDGNIDAVIGLPANLFFSTGIPVCILVLKKCKKSDDVLFINASDKENFEKGKKQNKLRTKDIDKIIDTYKQRKEEERYSRPVSMDEIERNGYNLNISRYVSIAKEDVKIDLLQVNKKLIELEGKIADASERHNKFLAELGLPLLTKSKEGETKH